MHKLTCGRRESVSYTATLDEKSTSSEIAESYARWQEPRGRKDDTCDHGLLSRKAEKYIEVGAKKINK